MTRRTLIALVAPIDTCAIGGLNADDTESNAAGDGRFTAEESAPGAGSGSEAVWTDTGLGIGPALAGERNEGDLHPSRIELAGAAAQACSFDSSAADGLKDPEERLDASRGLAGHDELAIGAFAVHTSQPIAEQYPDTQTAGWAAVHVGPHSVTQSATRGTP